jgi:TonB family protein
MKKLFTTAVVLLAMALASYASNSNASISYDGGVKPHSQQYQDLMKILDEYRQEFKNAQSCYDFELSVMMYESRLHAFNNNEYAEDDKFTQEEASELNDQLAQLATEAVKLHEQWDDKDCLGVSMEELAFKIVDGDLVSHEIFQIVEVMPQFPGGEPKLMEYISENIQYPQKAIESGIQGRVFVGFVIEPDGSVSNVKLLRGIGGGCDEEAMRVIKSLPRWEPGKQRGKAVRVAYQLPVFFKLTYDTEK